MKNYFTKLPNRLYYTREEGQNSILSITEEGITTLMLHYIKSYTGLNGISMFTLACLLEECGYTTHQKNVNKFKEILVKLKEIGAIECDIDLETIKKNDLLKITTEGLDLLSEESGFFILDNEVVETLKENIENKNGQMINTLNVYGLIYARSHKNDSKCKSSERKAPTTYLGMDIFRKEALVTNVLPCTNKLEELGLLHVKRDMQMTDYKGKVQNCSNIYLIDSLIEEGMTAEETLNDGFRFYKEGKIAQGYTNFRKITAEQKQQQTSNAGLKGQLKKQQNEGKENKELENRVDEINKQKKQNDNNNVIELSDIRTDKGIPKNKKVNPFKKAIKEDIEEPITRVDMFKSATNIMKQKQSKDINKVHINDIEEYDVIEYKREYVPHF